MPVSAFLVRHWFLPALAVALAVGFWGAQGVAPLADAGSFRAAVVATVLFLMGFTLHPGSMLRSIRKPRAWGLAIIINAAGVPLLAWAVSSGLTPAMGGGLLVAAVVPCTLASASVWTRQAGGDDAVAMMVTVVTNLFCFAIAPFWLFLFFARDTQIGFVDQAVKLALLVALPLLVAQAARRFGLAVWADEHKRRLSVVAQIGILVMVAVGASQSRRRYLADAANRAAWPDVLMMALAAVGVHSIALIAGILLARRGRLGREQQVAVGIAGSQKTLMVGLQLAIDCGVSMLPMIVYHIGQLLIDTLVVQRWAAKSRNMAAASQAEDIVEDGQAGDPEKSATSGFKADVG